MTDFLKKEIQLLASQMYFLKTNFQTIVWHLLRKNIISASRMMITIEHQMIFCMEKLRYMKFHLSTGAIYSTL